MSVKAGWSTPLLHVTEVERSIRFYERLGFQVIDSEGATGCLGWARMHTADGSAIMLLLAEPEVHIRPEAQGIMLVLYTPELVALREQLIAAGERPGDIEHPPWMPSGTMMLRDPSGYAVGVHQWGDLEHRVWLERLEKNRAAGAT
ncbi:MAG: VOC family protein [Thermoanaerobaculia bacterium]|nr:VOC family protein [Thermoanaerobaculia bacterium]